MKYFNIGNSRNPEWYEYEKMALSCFKLATDPSAEYVEMELSNIFWGHVVKRVLGPRDDNLAFKHYQFAANEGQSPILFRSVLLPWPRSSKEPSNCN